VGRTGRAQTRGRPRKAGTGLAQPLSSWAETTRCAHSAVTRDPGHCFLFADSQVGGEERRGSGVWLLARRVAFGPGATGRPRLGVGRENAWVPGPPAARSCAMGSRGSHAAVIPDLDAIRRETGCECSPEGRRSGDRPRAWGPRGRRG
jgi:hypothetical protein